MKKFTLVPDTTVILEDQEGKELVTFDLIEANNKIAELQGECDDPQEVSGLFAGWFKERFDVTLGLGQATVLTQEIIESTHELLKKSDQ